MDKTLEFFNKITTIPRPSGNEEKIRDFIVSFAKERNLEYYTDKTLNVIIKKPSNCNKNKTLILQAHTDMVCEKNANSNINFLTDPIKTKVEGDFLKAIDTTLGADNGIGLSMILSILDDNSINIPNLECVFTSQEETTMQGAIDLDCSLLKGKHLLSIDGTDEGKIEVSSAGMAVIEGEASCKDMRAITNSKQQSNLNNNCAPADQLNLNNVDKINDNNALVCYKISLSGFRGGHSGTEINSNRQNAIIVLFKFLKTLNNIQFVSICGGGKSNAIPRECSVIILAQNLQQTQLKTFANNFIKDFISLEPEAKLEVEYLQKSAPATIGLDASNQIIDFVSSYKNGVLVWSKEDKSFPITSNNFANINLDKEGFLTFIISVRSSDKALEEKYLQDILNQIKNRSFSAKITSKAPFFEKKQNSYLQNLCVNEYKSLFNLNAEINGVHAGLEGGVFANKIKDVDICVIAPNIYDAHSPMERVSLSSTKRVYSWLEKIVENF